MKKFLSVIGSGLKELVKLPVGMVQGAGGGPLVRLLLWLAALAILAAVTAGLWWGNESLGLDRFLRPPLPWLGRAWLPLLFLLATAAAWAGMWLYRVATTDPEMSEFPDIERAWSAALDAMARAEIDPREAPLYLVLGRLAGSSAGLIGASGLKFRIELAPGDPTAPLTVSASRDAIFVTSEGASLLGRFGELLAELVTVPEGMATRGAEPAGSVSPTPGAAGGPASAVATAAPVARPTGLPGASTLLQQGREVDRLTRRLRLLCLLIARDRLPFTPVNGIIVALPVLAAVGDSAANAWSVCRRDLATARQALGVDCPIIALFGDLERVEGFRELVERVPAERRGDPMGLDFPLAPDLPPARWPGLIRESVRWFALARFPSTIYHYYRDDAGDGQALANEPLFRLMNEVLHGHENLARILVQGIAGPGSAMPMLAGVYLAGTGATEGDRAFAEGVFRRALEVQDAVTWSPTAVEDDRLLRRRAAWGYATMAAWIVALLSLIAYRIIRVRS